MASCTFPRGFISRFICELGAMGHPCYPEPLWFVALRKAELVSVSTVQRVRCTIERREKSVVYCYQYEQEIADRSKEMYELHDACASFLRSRGLDTLHVSAWGHDIS